MEVQGAERAPEPGGGCILAPSECLVCVSY